MDTVVNTYSDGFVLDEDGLDFYVFAWRPFWKKPFAWLWMFFRGIVPIKLIVRPVFFRGSKHDFYNKCVEKIEKYEKMGMYDRIIFIVNDENFKRNVKIGKTGISVMTTVDYDTIKKNLRDKAQKEND